MALSKIVGLKIIRTKGKSLKLQGGQQNVKQTRLSEQRQKN